MQGLFAVYKREVALYFRSFIAYAIAFALLGIIGLLFTANIVYLFQQAEMSAQYGQAANVQLTPLISQVMGVLTFLMFLVAPLITMRLLAEESRDISVSAGNISITSAGNSISKTSVLKKSISMGPTKSILMPFFNRS